MNFCMAKEAGYYGSSIFHSNCANLHFDQHYMRFPFSLHPCHICYLFVACFITGLVYVCVRELNIEPSMTTWSI